PVLFPLAVYTGVDEGGGYTTGVSASGGTGIVWSSGDDSIASVAGTDALGTITAKKAGSTTVVATAGTAASVTVKVTQYVAADKIAGMALYMTKGCGAAACHGAGGPSDISPSGVGKHSDAEILSAVNLAMNPEGGMLAAPNHMF